MTMMLERPGKMSMVESPTPEYQLCPHVANKDRHLLTCGD